MLQLVFAGVAEGVVPTSLSCIQLLMSESREGILEPFLASIEETSARPARTCLSRTQLSLADARPGFLGADGAGEAGEGAWRRVRDAREEDKAAWLRIDGVSNGAKRRMDDGVGVGSSGGAAAAAVAEGAMAEADRTRIRNLGESIESARREGGGLRNSKRRGAIRRNAGDASAETAIRAERAREVLHEKGFAEGER